MLGASSTGVVDDTVRHDSGGTLPLIVVMIPVYKHAVYLAEAVASALCQVTDGFVHAIVIVDDGCPFIETRLCGQSYAARHSNVRYLRKPNGGPGAARNFGIKYIFDNFTNVVAVFFLDADNRLASHTLAFAYRTLISRPDIDWIYSSIETFHDEWTGDYDVPYSRLLHIIHENICDMGSLVSARLLRDITFDEDKQCQYEDWDFWLAAIAKGYRGCCLEGLGVEYRQRAGSRSKDADQDRETILRYLRNKYKGVFTPRYLLRLEHEEAPRYGLISVPREGAVYLSDPGRCGHSRTLEEAAADLWMSICEPDKVIVPGIYCWLSADLLDEMVRLGIARNVLWLVERLLVHVSAVRITVAVTADRIAYEILPIISDGLMPPAAIAMRRVNLADQLSTSQAPAATLYSDAIDLKISMPATIDPDVWDAVSYLAETVEFFRRSPFGAAPSRRWAWRPQRFPAVEAYSQLLRSFLTCDALLPLADEPEKAAVGFVLPLASFGGAEKATYAIALELRKAGYQTHAFILGPAEFRIMSAFREAFDSINLLGFDQPGLWGGSGTALGTEFPTESDHDGKLLAIRGMLAGMDVVINCHSAPANCVMSSLRALGVMTIDYLHLFDRSTFGREVGHPILAVMFEHAYDLLITCSQQLRHRLHGLGIPWEKTLTITNAPGFTIDEATRRIAREQRQERVRGRLRVLYLGRLDYQKGIDRLEAIVKRSTRLRFEFRVIGASLTDGDGRPLALSGLDNLAVAGPIYDSGTLKELLLWGNVLIMPSRWEGAPLVILEAQQLGCIPIVTRVGAITEQITPGVDGILVENIGDDAVITQFIAAMQRVLDDDQLRVNLAMAGIMRASSLSWRKSVTPLLNRLAQTQARPLRFRDSRGYDQ